MSARLSFCDSTAQNYSLEYPLFPSQWARVVAAIAIEHGLKLVTGNIAHFGQVRQHGYPLTLANWWY